MESPVYRIRGWVGREVYDLLDLPDLCRLGDLVSELSRFGRIDPAVFPFSEALSDEGCSVPVTWFGLFQSPTHVYRNHFVRFASPMLRLGHLGRAEVVVKVTGDLQKHIPFVVPSMTTLVMRRYPRIVGHIICESLGYATPTGAANILWDAARGEQNWCEWIYSCYNKDPRPAVKSAIQTRHYHSGYMAEYKFASQIVKDAVQNGDRTVLASWF